MDKREILETILDHLCPFQGISESIRIVAFCHLPEILVALKEAGQFRQPKAPSALEAPIEEKMLEAFLMPVVNSASHSNKSVAKEDLRTLHFLLQHLNVATHGGKAADLIPLLLNHFPEDDIELRNTSISIFGLLLNGLKDKHKVTENILNSLVPLFIQLSNDQTKEVSRNTLNSWVSFMTWWDVPTSLFNYEMYTSLHSMYSNIGFVVMNKCKENIPEMLAQMLGFLRSRNSSHRKAAALLIGCCVQYMKPDVVTSKEIEVFLSEFQSSLT
ncbi:uncharacterized protein LOC131185929 isoform X1 [Ahaetulla prasina]|uniref:uncharacterized protein LOC131185929 isoform X1 n=1 Tax=Ahaetulla prasina TaxID=499056 RepID=UPI0026480206|nr:uncharacterized protein LOC131185929 isoform X1 [Ahaetulla prasina]XP_058014908.1 uncharacterized protein LOC131185929 isoform X1 [Ahaetulla prasina]XP_058014909.1 uncharacterized protein LOC131185929 isoform X1 [Ahaetulla prasina]